LIGTTLITMPFSARSICHGTMLAWCSICDRTISSPSRRLVRPHDAATKLIASVALRVKTISRSSRALMKRCTVRRASSKRRVAWADSQ
jgi:hypothetical protein